MKVLFILVLVSILLINDGFCGGKIEHEKSTIALKDIIKVSPSKEQLAVSLPDLSKNLKDGEVIVCSQKGADGKFTLFYSSVSGGLTSEVLSGERETNTRKMFNSVGGMKPGDWMGVDFTYRRDGKEIPMKSHVFPVNESVMCVLVWPISGLSDDISYGFSMAKLAPPTPPVAATPLISPGAPMQQGQTEAVQPPADGAAPAAAPAPEQVTPESGAPAEQAAVPDQPAAEQVPAAAPVSEAGAAPEQEATDSPAETATSEQPAAEAS